MKSIVSDTRMMLKGYFITKSAYRLLLASLLLALLIFPTQYAAADDESDDVEVKLQSVIEAVDCEAMPQTLTILGLVIDINNAQISSEGVDDAFSALTCADLLVGQNVEAELASDLPDATTGLLTAVEIEIENGGCEDREGDAVEISAPIQAIDLSVPNITVLGLVVDISQALLAGDDDDDANECEHQPIDPSQLVVGQYIEAKLISSQPPLIAAALEVKNFTNGVNVDLIDDDGDEIDDGDVDDVTIDVVVTTKVKGTAATTVGPKRLKKVVSFHKTSNGSFALSGLPTGRAKIIVTRDNGDQISTAKRTVRIKGNRVKHLRMRLKTVQ